MPRVSHTTKAARPTDMLQPVTLNIEGLDVYINGSSLDSWGVISPKHLMLRLPAHSVNHHALDEFCGSVYPNDEREGRALGEKIYDLVLQHTAEKAILSLIVPMEEAL